MISALRASQRALCPICGALRLIGTQATPNPNSLKFTLGADAPISSIPYGTEFHIGQRTDTAPTLVTDLFAVTGVRRIFFSPDGEFVTVNKSENVDWEDDLQDVVVSVLQRHVKSDPKLTDTPAASVQSPSGVPASACAVRSDTSDENESDIITSIKELLDERIRPHVQADGGDVTFHTFDAANGVVWLQLQGACVACPSSTVTMQFNIRNLLMHYLDEVKDVKQVESEEDKIDDNWTG